MPAPPMAPPRQVSWREVVEAADGPDRHRDNLYPYVFEFTNGRKFRDGGPNAGIYDGEEA